MSDVSRRRIIGGLLAGLAAAGLLACGGPAEREAPQGHASLECDACHTGPIQGVAMRPAPPAACVRCHSLASLPDTVEIDGTRLAHTPHGEVAPGVPVPCSGCHMHASGDDPIAVTSGVCFDCHRAGTESGPGPSPIAHIATPCLECHTPTQTALTSSNTPINHALVVQDRIPCRECHSSVLRGSGAVDPAKCVGCHGQAVPELEGVATDLVADSLHRLHLTESDGMACTRCHEPLVHEIVSLSSTIQLNCVSCHRQPHGAVVGAEPEWSAACTGCHTQAHQAIQELYTGLGAGTDDVLRPEKMFLARVGCRACHTDSALAAGGPEARAAAIDRACTECHGQAYGVMLPRWTQAMTRRTRVAVEYVGAAKKDDRLATRPEAQRLLGSAGEDLTRVLQGNGLHNVPGADALLRSAVTKVASAYQAAGITEPPRPSLGPDPALVSCAYCHYGVEAVRDSVFGQSFAHADHVVRADLACSHCHTPADYFVAGTRRRDPEHGRTTVTTAECSQCHHVTTKEECTSCHTRGDLARRSEPVTLALQLRPAGAPTSRQVTFQHTDHPTVECTGCHTSRTAIRSVTACSDCHEAHHQQTRGEGCTTCHGTKVISAHTAENHFACADCHARVTVQLLTGTRPFCLTCHVDRADHRPGQQCAPCHMQMSPAQVRARILGGR